jgi:type 2 lantibiotic biosynthesis protein LanM
MISQKNYADALHLKEKVSLLNQHNLVAPQKHTPETEKTIKQWRETCLLINDRLFYNRLQAEGLTVLEFETALNQEPPCQKQPWANTFEEMMGYVDSVKQADYVYPLYYAFHPFLQWAETEIDKFLQSPFFQKVANISALKKEWLQHLSAHLLQSGARTLALEINYSRLLDQLEGETPQQRFAFFIEQKLKSPNYLCRFYEEYIALARLLTTRTAFFVNHVKEATYRLQKDYSELIDIFNIPIDKKLVSMKIGEGDSHQQGRSVIQFCFQGDHKLIYKPKPLEIADDVQALFEWINEKGFSCPLKTYRGLNRFDYRWEPKIEQRPVESREQVQRYYKRLGGILAVMYLLKGTDLHYENVIADGEYPVIIDFETVFSNVIKGVFEKSANIEAKWKVAQSVIGTGLLPTLGFQAKDGTGVEISGMGGKEQELPFLVLQVENEETDEIKFVRKPFTLKESGNLLKWNGQPANPSDFMEDLIAGFQEASLLAINHKSELLSESGPIAAMQNRTVRLVVRNTNYYSNFVSESTHPDYLRNSMHRENVLDRVFFTPFPMNVVMSEKHDLLDGDIPYFTTRPNSLHLYDSRGVVLPNVFAESGYQLVQKRIKQYDMMAMNEQLHYLKGSLVGSCPQKAKVSRQPMQKQTMANQYVEAAKKIGDKLLEAIVWGPDRETASWIGMTNNYKGQWHFAALDMSYYNGVIGVSLFLAHLAKETNEQKYKEASRAALQTVLENAKSVNGFPSVFYGPISVLAPLAQLRELYGSEQKIVATIDEKTNELAEYLASHYKEDIHYDVLGGSAGVVHTLVHLYERHKQERFIEIAGNYANHLIKHGKPITNNSQAWTTPTLPKGLGGFGHGNSGIASALLRYGAMTGDKRALDIGAKALHYDRSFFDHIEKRWRDNRFEEPHFNQYWCHGYVGIGFSRLLLLSYLNEPLLEKELMHAGEAALNSPLTDNHSLCHGDMGRADFLLSAGQFTGEETYSRKAHEIAAQVAGEVKEGNILTGGLAQMGDIGFFLGVSGIGYQLLRMHAPENIPSVLLMK